MTDKDKIIAEALGLNWSETYGESCGWKVSINHEPRFDNPDGFFKIMEIGPTRDWWRSFIQWWWRDVSYGYAMMAPSSVQEPFEILLMREFNPALFSGKLVEFLQERNK